MKKYILIASLILTNTAVAVDGMEHGSQRRFAPTQPPIPLDCLAEHAMLSEDINSDLREINNLDSQQALDDKYSSKNNDGDAFRAVGRNIRRGYLEDRVAKAQEKLARLRCE